MGVERESTIHTLAHALTPSACTCTQPHLLHACGAEHGAVSSTLCMTREADVVAATGQGGVVHDVVAAHGAGLALQVHVRLQQVLFVGNLGSGFACIVLSLGSEAGCTLLDVCRFVRGWGGGEPGQRKKQTLDDSS